MSKEDLIIIGRGGHAKVVIDIIEECDMFNIIGITDAVSNDENEYMGYPILGNDDVLPVYLKKGIRNVALGVGGFRDNLLRTRIFNIIKGYGFNFPPIIHPSAIVAKSATIGEGTVVKRGAIVDTNVEVGLNNILEIGSIIGHESKVGDHNLISGGVTIGANTTIESGVVCALGATVISGITVGKNILIGAGATVVNSINEEGLYLGCPAKLK